MSEVHYRAMTDDDAPAVNDLFFRVFKKQRSEALWKWLYRDTPDGPGVGVVAESKGQIIAHGGVIRRAFQIGPSRTSCGQSIDAMTDPAWQRQGINKGLQSALNTALSHQGIEVVFGFSNENSTYSVIQHQGRRPLEPFPLVMRPVRIFHIPGFGMDLPPARAAAIPEGVDALFSSPEHRVGVVRDAQYLHWRYRRPGGIYRECAVWENNELRGLGILSLRKQAGLRVAFISEFLVADESVKTSRQLLAKLLEEAALSGCTLITGLAFPQSSHRTTYSQGRFLPLPKWMQPKKVVFSVRSLDPSPPSLLYNSDVWDLSWGDHDLV